jgi:hypothetical protein
MKIAVIIPSRGRPMSLKGVLISLHSMSSSTHPIGYTILCDIDDQDTAYHAEECREFLEGQQAKPTGNTLTVIQDENKRILSARVNEIAATLRSDVYMQWPDDYFPMTQCWDVAIQYMVEQSNVPAFSWLEENDPTNHTAIVISKVWYEATGRLFPEYFPFWFGDTWMKEVFQYAFGAMMPIVQEMRIGGRRGKTQNLHDLSFWFRLFAETRDERIEDARKICKAMGLSMPSPDDATKYFEQGDHYQLRSVPRYELAFGSSKPRTQAYIDAKARAERLFPQLMEAA